MHQKSYIVDAIKRFGMEASNSIGNRFDPHVRLCKSSKLNVRTGLSCATTQGQNIVHTSEVGVAAKKRNASTALEPERKVPYCELIGCLLWISMGTRPDISYAVNKCDCYSSDCFSSCTTIS